MQIIHGKLEYSGEKSRLPCGDVSLAQHNNLGIPNLNRCLLNHRGDQTNHAKERFPFATILILHSQGRWTFDLCRVSKPFSSFVWRHCWVSTRTSYGTLDGRQLTLNRGNQQEQEHCVTCTSVDSLGFVEQVLDFCIDATAREAGPHVRFREAGTPDTQNTLRLRYAQINSSRKINFQKKVANYH